LLSQVVLWLVQDRKPFSEAISRIAWLWNCHTFNFLAFDYQVN